MRIRTGSKKKQRGRPTGHPKAKAMRGWRHEVTDDGVHRAHLFTCPAPQDYLDLPENERGSRCTLSKGWAIIDKTRLYLRGVFVIQGRRTAELVTFSTWARVGRDTFEHYLRRGSVVGGSEPLCLGTVCGNLPGYQDLDEHELLIWFGANDRVPRFSLRPSDHFLFREQRDGITKPRIEECLRDLSDGPSSSFATGTPTGGVVEQGRSREFIRSKSNAANWKTGR